MTVPLSSVGGSCPPRAMLRPPTNQQRPTRASGATANHQRAAGCPVSHSVLLLAAQHATPNTWQPPVKSQPTISTPSQSVGGAATLRQRTPAHCLSLSGILSWHPKLASTVVSLSAVQQAGPGCGIDSRRLHLTCSSEQPCDRPCLLVCCQYSVRRCELCALLSLAVAP